MLSSLPLWYVLLQFSLSVGQSVPVLKEVYSIRELIYFTSFKFENLQSKEDTYHE